MAFMSKAKALLFMLVLISLLPLEFSNFAQAGPVPRILTSPLLTKRQAPNSQQCTFSGNADIYGLGIRIGIYLQWTSGFLANNYHAEAVRDLLATNTIFLLALSIALALATRDGSIRAIEATILLQFCFGFLFSVSTIWGLRVTARVSQGKEYGRRLHFATKGTVSRLSLASAICLYNVWFWFRGLDSMQEVNCQAHGFLFAEVNLLDRPRGFFKVTAIALAINFGIALIMESMLMCWNWVCYAIIVAVAAEIISRRRNIPKSEDGTKKKFSWERQGERVLAIMDYVWTIPLLMVSRDTGVGFRRAQSWTLLRQVVGGVWAVLRALLPQILLTGCLAPLASAGGTAVRSILPGKTYQGLRKLATAVELQPTLRLLNLLCIVWSILAIEFMIKWNKITDVHSIRAVGQLIPLIIGVMSLGKLLQDMVYEFLQQSLYDQIMKSLSDFGFSQSTDEKKLQGGFKEILAASSAFADRDSAQSASGRPREREREPEVETQNADILEQALKAPTLPPPWEKFGFGRPNNTGPLQHQVSANLQVEKTSGKTDLSVHKKIWAHVPLLKNMKEELKIIRELDQRRGRAGNNIEEILRADTKQGNTLLKQTNAQLALDILERIKKTRAEVMRTDEVADDRARGTAKHGWRDFSRELHEVDVNPHVLAMRWISNEFEFWWNHYQWRFEVHKQVRNFPKREDTPVVPNRERVADNGNPQ
ncbi:hypothetical protein DL98DRAFT_578773 [Cadophora sp. DSE1049]|nr:hypothetical protein DL98DRAFT_578773 [Cadophora sp. DSE1049]